MSIQFKVFRDSDADCVRGLASKHTYSGNFATLRCDAFFDFDSVKGEDVGCLSQFYIKDRYRGADVGSELFRRSMEWLGTVLRNK